MVYFPLIFPAALSVWSSTDKLVVPKGSPANLTCQYQQDGHNIEDTKQLTVKWYKIHSNKSQLIWTFIGYSNKNEVAKGYTLYSSVDITNVKHEHAIVVNSVGANTKGYYECKVTIQSESGSIPLFLSLPGKLL